MAALNRPTVANYEIHENVRVDTQDNEDHTFCGIMFPIKAKQDVPVNQIVLHGVAVRGQLGPLTVWVSKENIAQMVLRNQQRNNNNNNAQQQQQQQQPQHQQPQQHQFPLQSRYWEKVYESTHAPSMRQYQWLHFHSPTNTCPNRKPVVLKPGQVRALYIHSKAPHDEAIVYDNANIHPAHAFRAAARHHFGNPLRSAPRYHDTFVSLHTGKAHLSPRPFGQTPIWGWGNAWRDAREFVGQVDYGVRFQLWSPTATSTLTFGPQFNAAVRTLLACQRNTSTQVARLPDECLYYILHLCKWDWFQDNAAALKEKRRQQIRRQKQRALEAEAAAAQEALRGQASAATGATSSRQEVTQESTTAATAASHACSSGGAVSAAMDEDTAHGVGAGDDTEMPDQAGEENADDDDDDDDAAWETASDEDDDDDEDSDSDESAWERQHGYRANTQVFTFHDVTSDDDEENGNDDDDGEPPVAAAERQAWFRRHFARIHILRALAQGNDAEGNVVIVDDGDVGNDVDDINSIMDSSSDDDDDDDNDEDYDEEAVIVDVDDDDDDAEDNYAPLQDTDDEA